DLCRGGTPPTLGRATQSAAPRDESRGSHCAGERPDQPAASAAPDAAHPLRDGAPGRIGGQSPTTAATARGPPPRSPQTIIRAQPTRTALARPAGGAGLPG